MKQQSITVLALLSWAGVAPFLARPASAQPSSGQPTLYILQNETAQNERTLAFSAYGQGEWRIGFECALGKSVDDTTGGFVEIDGKRIYTGRDMRRVFASQVAFVMTPGRHSITVGFDRPIYAGYVKIFGILGVDQLRPVSLDTLERIKTMIGQLSPSEKLELLDWLKKLASQK